MFKINIKSKDEPEPKKEVVKKLEKKSDRVVIPAKAGIQSKSLEKTLDSRLHGNDKEAKTDVRKTEVHPVKSAKGGVLSETKQFDRVKAEKAETKKEDKKPASAKSSGEAKADFIPEIGAGVAQKTRKEGEYSAKDITVLKGLEPVRLRPGMYIGGTGLDGLHHLIWEVVNNCLDEAIAGYAKEVEVNLLPNNRVSISDDGRGIPVEKHPDTGKSTLETVLTTLHAGGKFGGEAYKVSGGLHGVGISVVCALSTYMLAEVKRDGGIYQQEYFRGAPKANVKKVGDTKKTGTTQTFDADPQIFAEIRYDSKKILNYLRQQAYLTKGVKITFNDTRKKGEELSYTFYFEGGIKSYVKYLVSGIEQRHDNIFSTSATKDDIYVEAAFQYNKEMECTEESFCNNIYTPEGGTHVSGFRSALTRTLNDYARKEGFLKEKDENFSGDDVREGLTAVVSVKIRTPQFEGQTKAKLGNPEAKASVEAATMEGLADYLERYPSDAKSIVENCLLATKARLAAKAARQTVLRKGALEGLALPGKLADCLSRKPEESEIYIVEGDSAGGSSKMARDRRFQAILPLRGKILNVERARMDKILESKEIRALIIAMGTGIGEDFDIERLRYHRIVIMTDADVDGAHIRTLLLTFFYRHFKPVVEAGHIYIAQPPLYKISAGKNAQYAYSDDQRDKIVKEMGKSSVSIQRYKGLGEMNPEQLWETTMNPENRTLLQVAVETAHEADRTLDILMGEEVEPRKKFIQTHAKSVKSLDI
ncbi:MAG: gyrase subunit B protein [Parcubacteria group bacterium GW2011_GWC2_32_10]|nr:MAG: gyrase subunit B protein [Parcubacteria group bacterium GW2011_GWC2_32_10]